MFEGNQRKRSEDTVCHLWKLHTTLSVSHLLPLGMSWEFQILFLYEQSMTLTWP